MDALTDYYGVYIQGIYFHNTSTPLGVRRIVQYWVTLP